MNYKSLKRQMKIAAAVNSSLKFYEENGFIISQDLPHFLKRFISRIMKRGCTF